MSYFKNIFTTGAVSKTPGRILKEIMQEAGSVKNPALIIELGAGKGEITELIIQKFSVDQNSFAAFEINREFSDALKMKFPNVNIVSSDAFEFDKHIHEKADLIICSIPLSFFPKENRESLYKRLKSHIKSGGKVIILFHAFWLRKEMHKAFHKIKLRTFLHLPPYYIASYTKHDND